MGTCSFRDFEEVCKRLGLEKKLTKKGAAWEGIDSNGQYLRTTVHKHADGDDIAPGTFHAMVKQLGFANEQDFKDFLANKKRKR